MNQKQMIKECADKGYNFSLPLIYRYGKKYGFLVQYKEKGRDRYRVDEDKFREWLDNHLIDSSYISIKDACKKYDMTFSALKYVLKKNNCEITKLGMEQNGLYYAKRTDIERVIGQYNKRT